VFIDIASTFLPFIVSQNATGNKSELRPPYSCQLDSCRNGWAGEKPSGPTTIKEARGLVFTHFSVVFNAPCAISSTAVSQHRLDTCQDPSRQPCQHGIILQAFSLPPRSILRIKVEVRSRNNGCLAGSMGRCDTAVKEIAQGSLEATIEMPKDLPSRFSDGGGYGGARGQLVLEPWVSNGVQTLVL
jgi:hypothetical protein